MSRDHLPRLIAITGQDEGVEDFAARLATALQHGPDALVFRARQLSPEQWEQRLGLAQELCRRASVPLILATDPERAVPGAGLHLSTAALLGATSRPPTDGLLGASCHSPQELEAARRLGCDYAFLSPVFATRSPRHPPLGIEGLSRMIRGLSLPVHALGGATPAKLAQVQQAGAHGIAGINWCWPSRAPQSTE